MFRRGQSFPANHSQPLHTYEPTYLPKRAKLLGLLYPSENVTTG